ncbi:ABC transporter ATP-binding protein/permease [Gluconobacter cerinus]|uniref:ABC transporter ATP-binding protein/permease n=1 Tax=Gluconobacter cerinus TaxID=38307 RepID=UPI001B8B39EA|nr:ABC transporter ATP-binding protein/permease [Gluconobacter cerinus]MBS1045386.1 ABC transporter ATP-binding protein/permease [Gluconobacter cerinus]
MAHTEPPTPPHSLSDWKVLLPYWRSEDRWKALGLLGSIIGLSFLDVQVAVWFGKWDQTFFDTMFAYRVAACIALLPIYILMTSLSAGMRVIQQYMTQVLSMRWRLWNTRVYLRKYLSDDAYYHLEHGQNRADNPDQRIADDLAQMTVWTLRLGLEAIQAVTTFLSFAVVLWTIGGTLSFVWHGWHIVIPGYMFFGTTISILLVSFVLEKAGGPLVSANYRQQHYDADLRATLLDVRRNAEQIAFYGGEAAEHFRLSECLNRIAKNWRSVMTYTWRANTVVELYTGGVNIVLWALLVPKLLAHALTFGLYSRINSAFMNVRRSLQWFIENYTDLATLRSILQRLGEFERVVVSLPAGGIVRTPTDADGIEIKALSLDRSDGSRIVDIGSLHIPAGERWFISGPSGAGKSTMLRALAGLWTQGTGHISFNMRDAMFLPQRSYVPAGSLLQALSYPATPDRYARKACEEALLATNLEFLMPDLENEAAWGDVLSPGEQQRLAFARVFLARPSTLFLDEATSALDEKNEADLYAGLLERLPHITLISVAHHAALKAFHGQEMILREKSVTVQRLL